jgi:Spy/CpxP family protein refolding chaperone
MKRTFALLFLALAVAGSSVLAQPRERQRFMERQSDRLVDQLQLTDAQQSSMKKLRLDLERKNAEAQSKIRMARIDLKEQYQADKPERVRIERILKTISDLQHQLKLNVVDHWYSVNAILTAEQQKIWKEHAGRMGEGRRGDGFGPRMRGMMEHRMRMND